MIPLWRWIWSERFLFGTKMLWLLLVVNALGTVYGYIWYWEQLVETFNRYPRILLPFVPDSPTASLFFTLSLALLIAERAGVQGLQAGKLGIMAAVRAFIDAFSVVTLIKYGIWAVTMNFADGWQGGGITPIQWMLIASHLGMAIEALIYAKAMRYGKVAIALVAAWTLTNDYVDYHAGVHPYLFGPLQDDLQIIETFTWLLSLLSLSAAWLLNDRKPRTRQV